MYTLIQKLGALLKLKEQDFTFRCTYAWTVLFVILIPTTFFTTFTYLEYQWLSLLWTQGYSAVKVSPYDFMTLINVSFFGLIPLFLALGWFVVSFPKFCKTVLFISALLALGYLNYFSFFHKDATAFRLVLSMDAVVLIMVLCYWDWWDKALTYLLNKFCTRI